MMSRDAITGHQAILAQLEGDVAHSNVAHAYLFYGQAHVGKFTIAKWFAENLLLQGVPELLQPAMRQSIHKLVHPDLFVLDKLWIEDVTDDPDVLSRYTNISQEHRRKSGAKTNTISIDDVRAIQERLHEVGTGQFRCCLIRSVERMQTEAVNALLKIVEEPPPGLVFLFTAEDLQNVLPTLQSRCRNLALHRLPPAELRALVSHLPEAEQDTIIDMAQGAPGVVYALRNDPEARRQVQQLATVARSFWDSRSVHERLKLLKPLEERGEGAEALLFQVALQLRKLPTRDPRALQAFHALVLSLKTNASRPLLVQRFVLDISQ